MYYKLLVLYTQCTTYFYGQHTSSLPAALTAKELDHCNSPAYTYLQLCCTTCPACRRFTLLFNTPLNTFANTLAGKLNLHVRP